MKNRMRNLQRSIVNAIGISTFLLVSSVSAQTIEWIRQFGTSTQDYATDVSVDATGAYVVGHTAGSDAFLRKYDVDGSVAWNRQFGTGGFDVAYSVASVGTDVYVGGNFGSEAFVRKYDVNGNLVWANQFVFGAGSIVFGVAAASTGVYVVGRTAWPNDIDAFVRKYDTGGNEMWTRQFGSSGVDYASGISVNATGVFVSGVTDGSLPGQTNVGGQDAFVRKYDANGNEIWTRQFGTLLFDEADDIASDAAGIYVSGRTGALSSDHSNTAGGDAFIQKYDINGNEIWTRQFGTVASDLISSVDIGGNIVSVGGYTDGILPNQSSAGVRDAFVRTYDTEGNELFTYQFGTSSDDGVDGVASNVSGIYVVGSTPGTFSGQISAGNEDAFVVKFGQEQNQPPAVTTDNTSVLVNEGQIAANTGTVVDPDGDMVTLTSSVGAVTDNGNSTWSWNFATSDGPIQSQTVTIAADDGNGGAAQTSFVLTVNNVAPSVNAVTVPLNPINISSQPVSINATFNDPAGTNDEPYTCTIDFGDGSGPQAGAVSGMTSSGSHTYASAGVYVVTVTVTDKDNDSGSASATNFIVIYDPSAGFVTGGGWIDSPAGAYVADPTLIGKANFGFVSKYQKGKSIPDGNTTFHFNTANFKFKSTSYDWLVIAGPKAQYKGVGTVNNSGNYGFMLFARDGQINGGDGVDKFRIKIWDKNNGDAVVYDNQMGDPDDGDASDAIEGGSITIHSGSAKAAASSNDEESASIPTEYALEQNYPNPFNPSTRITFALPEAGEVKLFIYNTSGQLMRTLVAGQKTAGTHSVMWDASDNTGAPVASGVYLYVLKAGNFISQKKLLLMK